MFLNLALASLALLSLALTLWQWLAARRFPLHQRAALGTDQPPVTLLKPLKGCDAETSECLRSWLRQDYNGPIQILFGVASDADPVCGLVRQVMAEHPKRDARLVFFEERPGPNGKVSTLIQLERLARHEIICVSDADVWAPPDLLANVVGPLADPGVGLVRCLYRLAGPSSLATRWEAFANNADFWSQVLQAQSLKPLDFALGAAMTTNRRHLKQLGGFNALADYLADDYQLGNRLAQNGARLVLSPVVVECRSAPTTWAGAWRHQLRWARTIRFCKPLPFFFSILSNGTVWPALWALWHPNGAVLGAASLCLAVRIATACSHEWKLTGQMAFSALWLAPFKDVLHLVLWALSFLGRRVTWRGERFRVKKGGRLVRV